MFFLKFLGKFLERILGKFGMGVEKVCKDGRGSQMVVHIFLGYCHPWDIPSCCQRVCKKNMEKYLKEIK